MIYIEKSGLGRVRQQTDLPMYFKVHSVNKGLNQIRALSCSRKAPELIWDALGVVWRGQRLKLISEPILRLEAGEWLFNVDMGSM